MDKIRIGNDIKIKVGLNADEAVLKVAKLRVFAVKSEPKKPEIPEGVMVMNPECHHHRHWHGAAVELAVAAEGVGTPAAGTVTAVWKAEQQRLGVWDIVSVDTVYIERTEVRLDTTYVYDSYREHYVIGRVDTTWNIRVDTVKVETINYIYKETVAINSDSTASTEVNRQQASATEVRVVEPEKKRDKAWDAAVAILLAGLFGVVGFFIGRYR